MQSGASIQNSLIEVDDSVLLLVDIQDYFLKKYSDAVSLAVLKKAVWMIQLARAMNVPIVAMAEDIETTGNLCQTILDALPLETKVHNKNTFGLGGHPEILESIRITGRNTAVLIGMETDVCVAHSALHLMKDGYNVVVLKDVVATTNEYDGGIGLGRMRDAGAVVSSAKGIYYEWLRSVEKLESLLSKNPEIRTQAPVML